MNWKREYKSVLWIAGFFLAAYFMPVGTPKFNNALYQSFHLLHWYAREHVILCLVPAFFIAGAISVFISQASVMKYLGVKEKKVV